MKKTLPLIILSIIVVFTIKLFSQAMTPPPPAPQTVFVASLNAAQESPSDTSHGTATFFGELSPDGTTMSYHITYAGLTSSFTAAHFHLGMPGVSGGVVEGINSFNGNSASGSWSNIPDSIFSKLLKGEIYVNIHTTKYPGGELRGQLEPAKGIAFVMSLDASGVTSADSSTATGTGWAVLTDSNSTASLSYGITIAGLSGTLTAAHFHFGQSGTNGGVAEPITFTDSSAYGTWSNLTNTDIFDLITGGIYVNVHSTVYPGGEIRSQLNRIGSISFTASLDGSNETPAVNTSASGTGWFELSDDGTSLAYRITYANLSGGFTGSHFHIGMPGVSGGVVEPITTFNGNTATGVWTNIPDTLAADLIKGGIYVNVHSTTHTGGEIRGQVNLTEGETFIANLGGSFDVPPVSTEGSGTAWLLYSNDTLFYRITVAGLSSKLTAAHFHLAPSDSNGGVIEAISYTDSTTDSFWANISDDILPDIFREGVYINVHTSNFPAGEIRGQVLTADYNNSLLTGISNKDNITAAPSTFYLSQNYPNPFNPTTIISYSLPFRSSVSLKIYDILGREVANLVDGQKSAGNYKVEFNASNLASGIYFYSLKAGSFVATKKLVLLK